MSRIFKPELRRASVPAGDGESILAIYNESIRRGEISQHGRELPMGELPEILLPSDHYYTYVATVEGVVRGWSAFRPWHQRAAFAPTVELLVYVAATYRGHGLAKALVSQVITSAFHGGYRSIIALALADDAVAARLFQSTGFSVAGAISGVFPGTERLRDVTLYQRFLTMREYDSACDGS